ncbi:hypothetical protein ACQ86B_13650 [Mycolicibacterium aichiense]|uniref:hypothetical protein n=1 Tax=Mycolicibacterium aichiense TaxID=1799 RepID=UPI003D668669
MRSHDEEMPAGLLDIEGTRCLCDVGCESHWAASVIGPDGSETLWLLEVDSLNHPAQVGNPMQAHELNGPLPAAWQARVEAENQKDVDDGKAQP